MRLLGKRKSIVLKIHTHTSKRIVSYLSSSQRNNNHEKKRNCSKMHTKANEIVHFH